MIKRRGWLGWVAGVALGGAVCGCGGELAPGRAYTGKVESTDARVALVEQGDRVRAYVCGGPASFQDLSRWYTLKVHETAQGKRAVEGESEGWLLAGELGEEGASGVLQGPAGAALRWEATVVAAGASSGLYEASDDLGKIGAVVEDQRVGEPVVQGTWLGKGGYKAQVTPVRPVILPGELRIKVESVQGPRVRPLAPVLPSP